MDRPNLPDRRDRKTDKQKDRQTRQLHRPEKNTHFGMGCRTM